MNATTHSNGSIEVRADFAQASSLIQFRNPGDGDDEWQASVYRVADAAHDPERALEIVSAWAGMQS